ncbi:MAG: hypothetical protein AAGA53_00175 [Pseudomonadota bacterium]
MRVLPVLLSAFLVVSSDAFAKDVPEFLKGRVFSTDTASCGDVGEGDGLQLTREGIFGPEFSCTFLGFQTDQDPDTGRIWAVVANANCSDDSGISRPDNIALSPYIEGGEVYVQSQNEYLLSEAEILVAQKLGQEIPEKSDYAWVSNTYKICE